MASIIKRALDWSSQGFTLDQKIGITVLAALYVICPLDFDFIPLLGWCDDGFVLVLLSRVWAGPTLPSNPEGGGAIAVAKPEHVPASEVTLADARTA